MAAFSQPLTMAWRITVLVLTASLFATAVVARGDDPRPKIAATPPGRAAHAMGLAGGTAAADSNSSKQQVNELIRQLGSPRFTERRAAASELRRIGAEAFDSLHAATDDADPEVAASARYLLRQITVRWVQHSDSAAVRALLRDYGVQPGKTRLRRAEDLAKLPHGEGIGSLARIARFDRSPLVSRTAALGVIRPADKPRQPSTVDVEVIERELGSSTREAAVWLRRYLVQLRDPAAAAEEWQKLVDEEAARLEQNADDTSAEVVIGLLWNLAELHRQLDHQPELLATIDRMFSANLDAVPQTAVELLSWLMEHQAWTVLEEFLTRHMTELERHKRPLYYAAMARARQGQNDLAEQLAAKAAALDSQGTLESFITAKDLEERSQLEWAVREYRRGIDEQQVAAHEGILCRVYLSSLLHDYERHSEAADAIEPLVKAVQNEGRVGQLYAELGRYYAGRLDLPTADELAARHHYYRACHFHAGGDYERERQALELAVKFDATHADVLIAMYRLPDADAAWLETTRQRIREAAAKFQRDIDANPNDPTSYNQWAWLISNTEGDYQKAIRYSHRSLELIPPSAGESAGASFLDTLGRCYYAAGDLENAVKYQRQAIQKVNYMQVMHRQLALFEKALAEKQDIESGTENGEKPDK